MRKLVFRLYRLVVKLATFLHLPSDKVLHLLCSAMIMLLLQLFLAPPLAACLTLGIGVLKELYDCIKPNPTGWDWGDIVADVVGIAIVLIFVV